MHISDSTISFLETITGISLYFLFLGFLFFILFFYKKERTRGVLLILFDIKNHLSVFVLKSFFSVPRPSDTHIETSSYAFPSSHTAGISFIVFALFFNLPLLVKDKRLHYLIYIVGIALIVFIGWSRIYLGAHTLPQTIGGALVGIFWAYAYKKASDIIVKK